MWKAFSSSYNRTISDDDLKSIEVGICPRRTNGTLSFNRGRMETLDLSERATVESGRAFATAIRDYCVKYPARSRDAVSAPGSDANG